MLKLASALAAVGVSAAAPHFVGVNIGGWLVLESWIYPTWWSSYSSYNVTPGMGEWQFCQQLGPDACLAAITPHWDTWLQESDLAMLASAGVTHLRIPVGYWILGPPYLQPGEPYPVGGWQYLIRGISWAYQYGLKVVIDLHGAPGSQNGHDNSGSSGPIDWPTPTNIQRTVDCLVQLAKNIIGINQQYPDVVVGLELLNEPWTTAVGGPIQFPLLAGFYKNATDAVRATGFTGDIWFHDGFDQLNAAWQDFLPPPAYQNIYMDTHLYHCFGGPTLNLSPYQQINYACTVDGPRLQTSYGTDWIITGEWSLSLQTEPSYPFNWDDIMYFRAFAEAQMQAYGMIGDAWVNTPAKGGFFWNFKTESSPTWNYLLGLADGYIPNMTLPLTQSTFNCSAMTGPLPSSASSPSSSSAVTRSRLHKAH